MVSTRVVVVMVERVSTRVVVVYNSREGQYKGGGGSGSDAT